MKPSRRSFLAGAGTLLAAAAATPLHAIVPVHPGGGPNVQTNQDSWIGTRPLVESVTQFQWTQNTFVPFVNTNFQVANGQGQKMVLRLLSVQDTRKQNTKSTTAFALIFQFVGGTPFGQGTYEFSNPQLGKFLLFIVGKKSKGASYVAIINRL